MPDQIESTSGEGLRGLSRLMRALELPALLAMPIILALFLASDIRATAALTLACVLFVLRSGRSCPWSCALRSPRQVV